MQQKKIILADETFLEDLQKKIDIKAFTKELSQKVHGYFKEKEISYRANAAFYIKAALMLTLYLGGYAVLAFGLVQGTLWWALWPIMGTLVAGVGMCVMHDASHQACSKNKKINTMIGWTIYLLGAYMPNWIEQHAVRHHTYTNVDPRDEDVAGRKGLLRFHPGPDWYPGYSVQHITAWIFYGFMNIHWMTTKDFQQFARYVKENGMTKQQVRKHWLGIITLKVLYFGAWFVVPVLLGAALWQVVVGWLLMQFVAGLILTITFQMAHVVTGCMFFKETLDINFTGPLRSVFQLLTTSNFKTKLGWYMGGLNHQIEHHLFPTINHIHYPKIAPIVHQVCQKYGIPYNLKNSWAEAIVSHYHILYMLGRKPAQA